MYPTSNSSRIGIGNDNPDKQLTITGNNYSSHGISTRYIDNTILGGRIEIGKARGALNNTLLHVHDGDRLGVLEFQGHNGTEYKRGAGIFGIALRDYNIGVKGGLEFKTVNASNYSTQMAIDEDGNVGIGTGKLTVTDLKARLEIREKGTILGPGGTVNVDNAALLLGTPTTGLAFDANQIESIGGKLYINNASDENVILANGGGDVGIGASPIARLQVPQKGTIAGAGGVVTVANAALITGTHTLGLAFDNNQIESVGVDLNLNYTSNRKITLGVGGGNVGIGKDNPGFGLDVDVSSTRFDVGASTYLKMVNISNSFVMYPSVHEEGYIGTGTFAWKAFYGEYHYGQNPGSFLAYSDQRIKENRRPLLGALDLVKKVKSYTYDIKSDHYFKNAPEKDPEGRFNEVGFMAQEIEKNYP